MRYRVLIADDEISVRNLLKKKLQDSEFPIDVVAVAEDGKEALAMALEYQPDIMIVDIEMPFLNGLEVIKALQEKNIHTKNVIISGYDEFDYARKAVSLGVTSYLLKPFMPQDLISALEKVIRELDSQNTLKNNLQRLRAQADKYQVVSRKAVMKALLEGKPVSEEDMEKIGFAEEKQSRFLSCIIRVSSEIWNFEDQEQAEEFFELIRVDYFSDHLRLYGIGLDAVKLVLCFQCTQMQESEFLEEVAKGMEKLSHSMQQYYDIVLYCAIGRTYRRISGLKTSYEDAHLAWKEILEPQTRIWIYKEKQQEKQLKELEVSNRISHLKSCIRGAVGVGNYAEAMERLKQLMQMYALEPGKENDYLFISVVELVYRIADDMDKMGLEKVDQKEILQLSSHVVSLMEVKEAVERYLEACCRIVSENLSANRTESVVHHVQVYVEEHLMDRTLSVESMSEITHFSVSYLRQIFKEVTGESFNEYLIRKRMEKAGEMLRDSSMKIQEISEKCGYENQRYFASSFKKFFGCTPTEYKAIILANK